MQPFSLVNETALITGGGTGLGLAIARSFVQSGARVILTGRRYEVLEQAISELGKNASCLPGDITDLESLADLWKQAESAVGSISILVNNAGVHLKKPALETSLIEFASIQQVHLQAPFLLTRLAAESMCQRKHGSIVFVSSMAGLFGIPQVAAYSAAKAGIIGLTRALAAEWSSQGVRVNALAPGWIETDLNREVFARDPRRKARILDRTPMNCFGATEDIGWAATYLCSPAARFITGIVLPVDGGASIGF